MTISDETTPTASILRRLAQQWPEAQIAQAKHDLAEDAFHEQKRKHLSHGAQGGVIGILQTPDGRVVLAHRSKLHAGWSLPGGTVEADESFEEAFRREIKEEIGVEPLDPLLIHIEEKIFVSPAQETLPFILATFAATIAERDLPPPTDEARKEGLTMALFEPQTLPENMIFGDKKKIEAFFRKSR